jgi:uncharacterized protein
VSDIERKTIAFDVKAGADDGEGPGSVELDAAVFGNIDRAGEVIAPGAFKNLDLFVAEGWLAWQHDWDAYPIATIRSAMQDGSTLRVVADWHSTDDAQECRTVVKERVGRGKAVKCSIGYRVLEDAIETRDGMRVRVLKAVELYEASIVNLPCNPAASVVGVKGRDSADGGQSEASSKANANAEATRLLRARINLARLRMKAPTGRGGDR